MVGATQMLPQAAMLRAALAGQKSDGSPLSLLREQEPLLERIGGFLAFLDASPQGTGAGPAGDSGESEASKVLAEASRLEGVVKSYAASSGYGFISCSEVHQTFGCDVFLHKMEVESSGAAMGDTVRFGVRLNKAGKPQAWAVEVLGRSPAAPAAADAAADTAVQGSSAPAPAQGVAAPGGSGARHNGKTYTGILKSFNREMGFGFIACEETHEAFGRDVFVHPSTVGDLQVGAEVDFHLFVEPQRGFPQARGVTPARTCQDGGAARSSSAARARSVGPVGSAGAPPAAASSGEAAPRPGPERSSGGSGSSARARSLGSATAARSAARAEGAGAEAGGDGPARYTGVVKSINSDAGFGFIACEETHEVFGRDVFAKQSQLEGLKAGDSVSFSVAVDPARGFPQARALEPVSARPELEPRRHRAPAQAGAWLAGVDSEVCYTGVVRTRNELGGYGFVACQETYRMFGRDVFVNPGLMAGVRVGDVVSFRVAINPAKGPQASTLEPAPARGLGAGGPQAAVAIAGQGQEGPQAARTFSGLGRAQDMAQDQAQGTQAEATSAPPGLSSGLPPGLPPGLVPLFDAALRWTGPPVGAGTRRQAGHPPGRFPSGAGASSWEANGEPKVTWGRGSGGRTAVWLGPERPAASHGGTDPPGSGPVRDYGPEVKAQRALERRREAELRRLQREGGQEEGGGAAATGPGAEEEVPAQEVPA